MMNHQQIELTKLLASRLERLPVDSIWSHRAGGLRGNLLKVLEEIESGNRVEEARLALLIEKGFAILRNAALEIPDLPSRRCPEFIEGCCAEALRKKG